MQRKGWGNRIAAGLLAACALALAGCGGGGGSSTPDAATTSATQNPTGPPAPPTFNPQQPNAVSSQPAATH